MTSNYPFIFSNAPSVRWKRHLLFWGFWWVFMAVIYSVMGIDRWDRYGDRLGLSLLESLLYIVAHIFLAYYLIYFVIPRFLFKHKYVQTVLLCLAGFVIAAAIAALIGATMVQPLREYFFEEYKRPIYRTWNYSLFFALMPGLRGAITIGGIAAAIKIMKSFALKEERNLLLQKQHIEAQLQILKAQIQPHFLFNTLNNIYSESIEKSPKSANMVMRLSSLLRFVLYESSKEKTPLQHELQMLQDYMELEKTRYPSHFDLRVELPEDTRQLQIAPLLLLPLIENAFKHGSSQTMEQPWIHLKVQLIDHQMRLTLINGKPENKNDTGDYSGIGLQNVRKRLAYQYPNQHELQIIEEPQIFIVKLDILLQTPHSHLKNLYQWETYQPYVASL